MAIRYSFADMSKFTNESGTAIKLLHCSNESTADTSIHSLQVRDLSK